MFLRNYWYVAADAHEITDVPFPRTILNEPIVFWRKTDGTPVAMEDRCCHRLMPLRKGHVASDRIVCHYHGLQFNADGQCVHVPGQTTIPPGAQVKTYPVVERYKWLWIWMGDPALANPDEITPFPWKDHPEFGDKGTYFHVRASAQLVVDNLLDLSHLAFVHQSTIGNYATAEKADTRTFKTDNSVTVARWIVDAPPPPTYVKAGGFTTNVDRWQIMHWTPPYFVRLFTGAAPGAAEGKDFGFTDLNTSTPKGGIGLRNLDAMTPETENTCHYFWSQAHDIKPITPERNHMIYNQILTAFHQDWEVFEWQQKMFDREGGNPKTIDINVDAGLLASRKIMDRLFAEEQAHSRSMRSAAE